MGTKCVHCNSSMGITGGHPFGPPCKDTYTGGCQKSKRLAPGREDLGALQEPKTRANELSSALPFNLHLWEDHSESQNICREDRLCTSSATPGSNRPLSERNGRWLHYINHVRNRGESGKGRDESAIGKNFTLMTHSHRHNDYDSETNACESGWTWKNTRSVAVISVCVRACVCVRVFTAIEYRYAARVVLVV